MHTSNFLNVCSSLVKFLHETKIYQIWETASQNSDPNQVVLYPPLHLRVCILLLKVLTVAAHHGRAAGLVGVNP